eukprot:gene2600-3302_t
MHRSLADSGHLDSVMSIQTPPPPLGKDGRSKQAAPGMEALAAAGARLAITNVVARDNAARKSQTEATEVSKAAKEFDLSDLPPANSFWAGDGTSDGDDHSEDHGE